VERGTEIKVSPVRACGQATWSRVKKTNHRPGLPASHSSGKEGTANCVYDNWGSLQRKPHYNESDYNLYHTEVLSSRIGKYNLGDPGAASRDGARDTFGWKFIWRTEVPLGTYSYRTSSRNLRIRPADWPEKYFSPENIALSQLAAPGSPRMWTVQSTKSLDLYIYMYM